MQKFREKHLFYSEHIAYLIWGLIIFFILYFSFTESHPWYFNDSSPNMLCFFLIATLGISHGAYDHLKGKKILKIFKVKNIFIFYFLYIAFGLLIILLWININLFMLIILRSILNQTKHMIL